MKALDDSWMALEGHERPWKSLKGPVMPLIVPIENPMKALEHSWNALEGPERLRLKTEIHSRAKLPPVKKRNSRIVIYLLCRMTSGLKPRFKDCAE